MGLSVVTPSTVEPVSIAEFKAHARIDGNHEDDLCGGLITAARQYCEAYLNRNLTGGTNSLRLTLDSFYDKRYSHCGTVYLPNPPLANTSSLSITYLSSEGSTGTTLGSSVYTVDANSEPARVRPSYNDTWPIPINELNAVTINYTAGYADAAAVPGGIKTAIKLMASHLYEHREAVHEGGLVEMPLGIRALLDPHKWGM